VKYVTSSPRSADAGGTGGGGELPHPELGSLTDTAVNAVSIPSKSNPIKLYPVVP
jgi:prophage DNA circulation protein